MAGREGGRERRRERERKIETERQRVREGEKIEKEREKIERVLGRSRERNPCAVTIFFRLHFGFLCKWGNVFN